MSVREGDFHILLIKAREAHSIVSGIKTEPPRLLMSSPLRKSFLYFQLLWHHLTYFTAVTEPERFHSNLGVTYCALGQFQRAIAHLEKSETLRHRDDRSFAKYNSYYLGFSYMNLDEWSKAVGHLEDYLRLKPDDEYVKECVSWCRSQQGCEVQLDKCG